MSQYGTKPANAGTYWEDLRIMMKKIRLICGYSQADVAKELGISRPAYTYYESGRTTPDVVTLVALARVYQILPECFLHPEEFTNLETSRKCTSKKALTTPNRMGELSPDERRMIAEYRLRDTAGASREKM